MASRRMVSVKIIDSARFIKMPPSTQALYFHLIARADDDGIVEAYNVLRLCGATEDDLKILVAKGYVTVLNEDLVAYINDWQEHNLIRSDRKIDSIYQDLLVQIVPDVQLTKPRQRADRKPQYLVENNEKGDFGTSQGQPEGGIGKDRLGEVSIGKDRLGEVKVDCSSIAAMYNDTCVSFPKIKKLSDARKKAIKARLNTYTIDDFKLLFEKAEASDFLRGKNSRDWQASFDWLIKDANMAKVIDGNYDNNGQATNKQQSEQLEQFLIKNAQMQQENVYDANSDDYF